MIKISKEQLELYKEQGYLIVRNAIDINVINAFSDFIAHVVSLEGYPLMNEKVFTKKEILNDLLIQIKRKNPASSSWIYQTILSSYALRKFFNDIAIIPLVMELLEMKDVNNLGTVSPAFRFDIPGDTKNIRTWHQDSNYFLENEKGSEHLVTWIPINQATRDNGSVIIAPKTHKNGRLDREHEKASGFKSEQYTTSKEQFEGVDIEYIEAEPGDIAFINMDLIHSSGTNITTDSVRYTAQIRFNTINVDSYKPVHLKPEYHEYQRLKQLLTTNKHH